MHLSNLIGHQALRDRLIDDILAERLPHALMLCGPEGNGALALAVALAQYVLCQDRAGRPAEMGLFGEIEAVPPRRDCCGECLSCRMSALLEHPDLHFIFPIYRSGKKGTQCDDYLSDWRQWLLSDPYGGLAEWTTCCRGEGSKSLIYTEESDIISRKLSLKSSQGGWRVCLIYLPEKMHDSCANKMLKLLEEPPASTLFILVSERPEQVIETVRSRTQMISVPPLPWQEIQQALISGYGLEPAQASRIARLSGGSLTAAIRAISTHRNEDEFLSLFIDIMRLCYQRKVREMKLWSESISEMNRERQLSFVTYLLRLLRENFVYNFHLPDLQFMTEAEEQFAQKFAPFINERNIRPLMQLFERAYADVQQNANSKIVFFDVALKMTVLIRQARA